RWSRSAAILWPIIHELASGLNRSISVLDIATGAGDVPIELIRRSRRAGLAIEMHACDISRTAIAHARDAADVAGASIDFFVCDVLGADLRGTFDVCTSSLFLHHLAEQQAE